MLHPFCPQSAAPRARLLESLLPVAPLERLESRLPVLARGQEFLRGIGLPPPEEYLVRLSEQPSLRLSEQPSLRL
jgi:hypothetical protein